MGQENQAVTQVQKFQNQVDSLKNQQKQIEQQFHQITGALALAESLLKQAVQEESNESKGESTDGEVNCETAA